MLDLWTVGLVIVVAAGYTYVANRKSATEQQQTQGPADHYSMPEVEFVYPMETNDMDASCFLTAGRSYQVGAFGLQ